MNDEWLTRELRASIRCHQALLRATDEHQLLNDVCEIICSDAGYEFVWVGYAEDDVNQNVRPVAWAGNESGYLSDVKVSWGDESWSTCPIGTSIRTGAVSAVGDFATDPAVEQWAAAATKRGYVGCIGLPLVGDDGKPFGALGVYSGERDRFDADEQELLQGLAADLAFGLNSLRRRALARQQNQLFRAAWETSPDAMLITSVADGTISDVNRGFEELLGWNREQALGSKVLDIHFWANPADREVFLGQLRAQGVVRHLVKDFGRADGSTFTGDISSRVIHVDAGEHILSVLRDVTAEHEAAQALRQSEERFRAVSEASHDFIWEIDSAWKYTYLSPKVTEILGYEVDELIGRTPFDLMPHDEATRISEQFAGVYERRETYVGLVNVNIHKNGELVILETNATPIYDVAGQLVGYRGADRDITERTRSEEELNARTEMLSQAQRVAKLGHYVFEPLADRWSSSPALDEIFGIDESYVKDVSGWLELIHPADRSRMAEYVADHVLRQHRPFDTYYRIVRKSDGEERAVHGLGELDISDEGLVTRMFGIIQDTTDTDRVQAELQRSEERYHSISETVSSFVYSCVKEPGSSHHIDWIAGAVDSLTGYPAARFMSEGCWKFIVAPEDIPLFESKVCLSNAGETAVADMRIVRADGQLRWIRSSVSASELEHLPGGVRIVGSVEDITDKRQAESDLVATNARLEGVMKSLVETMAKVVEARDPYTEGHERGVARIARQLAERMGLDENEIEGIEVAATVHDIGKLAIPAEILSKPSKLTEIEYEFVKQHSQAGYDILKGIDFGWPVAEMALQHHERMDGSGYPQGLDGPQILRGARVIMVADVVEAMSCHRPYRPGHGLDAAVEEVRSHPEKFDQHVVAALLELYSENLIVV